MNWQLQQGAKLCGGCAARPAGQGANTVQQKAFLPRLSAAEQPLHLPCVHHCSSRPLLAFDSGTQPEPEQCPAHPHLHLPPPQATTCGPSSAAGRRCWPPCPPARWRTWRRRQRRAGRAPVGPQPRVRRAGREGASQAAAGGEETGGLHAGGAAPATPQAAHLPLHQACTFGGRWQQSCSWLPGPACLPLGARRQTRCCGFRVSAARAPGACCRAGAIPHRLVKKRAVNPWGLFVFIFFLAAFVFYVWARATHTLGLGSMLW